MTAGRRGAQNDGYKNQSREAPSLHMEEAPNPWLETQSTDFLVLCRKDWTRSDLESASLGETVAQGHTHKEGKDGTLG